MKFTNQSSSFSTHGQSSKVISNLTKMCSTIVNSLLFACLFLYTCQSQAQMTMHNFIDYNWTGLEPDTIPGTLAVYGGIPADGVINGTVGTPVLLSGSNCGDTLYTVYSSLDVTNNPLISWDYTNNSSTDVSQSFTTIDGKIPIIYDRPFRGGGFLSGEDNKITAAFTFEKVVSGTVTPVDKGLKFTISQMGATTPPETVNIRVYNGTNIVLEQVGITNSNRCAPLDPAGTSSGTNHIVELPVGTLYDRLEIDYYLCADYPNGDFRVELSEFILPGATCPTSVPSAVACPIEHSYYVTDWVKQNISNQWNGEIPGQLHGGKAFESRWFRYRESSGDPVGDDISFTANEQGAEIQAVRVHDASLGEFKNGQALKFNMSNTRVDHDFTTEFVSEVINPLLVIQDMDSDLFIHFEDIDGNPLDNIRVIGNEPGVFSYDNVLTSNGATANAQVILEFLGSYSSIVMKFRRRISREGALYASRIGAYAMAFEFAECAADVPDEVPCLTDLYQWKVDTFLCEYLFRDMNDNFYKIDDRDFDNFSFGESIFNTEPIDGTVTLLQRDVLSACPDQFECAASGINTAVKIESTEPNGDGYFYDQLWFDADISVGPAVTIGGTFNGQHDRFTEIPSQWDDPQQGPFAGPLDVLGLPTHGANGVASGIPANFEDDKLEYLGLWNKAGTTSRPNPMRDPTRFFIAPGKTGQFNYQQDGWLAVPPGYSCMEFSRTPASATGGSSILYVIESDGNVATVIDNRSQSGYHTGTYCINNPHAVFGNGWQLLRVRYYGHNTVPNFLNTLIRWNIIGPPILGETRVHGDLYSTHDDRFSFIPSNFFWTVDNPESLVLPSNLEETKLETRYAVRGKNGLWWEPNGTNEPTTRIEYPVNKIYSQVDEVITDCTGQPDPTSGATCQEALDATFCQLITNCEEAMAANVDICEILEEDPDHAIGALDCDGGGQDNLSECNAGNNPSSIEDDVVVCDPVSPAPVVGNE